MACVYATWQQFGVWLQELANDVKQQFPNKDMKEMIEQLQRFLEFMAITVVSSLYGPPLYSIDLYRFQKLKSGATRSMSGLYTLCRR